MYAKTKLKITKQFYISFRNLIWKNQKLSFHVMYDLVGQIVSIWNRLEFFEVFGHF